MVRESRSSNETEAVQAAKQLGFPVAMKVISQEISHKSDVGECS